ncbi:hypothetical protein CWC03_20935 [Pseudoalteromonas sp. S2755]|nr:hypothetical protein CWC03_20935 [Pseudoalteromonas sp. S2755]
MSAFDRESGLTVYQRTVENKYNEILAVRALLDVLDISDSIVTLDALHCHKATLSALISREADYLVQVKQIRKHFIKQSIHVLKQLLKKKRICPKMYKSAVVMDVRKLASLML